MAVDLNEHLPALTRFLNSGTIGSQFMRSLALSLFILTLFLSINGQQNPTSSSTQTPSPTPGKESEGNKIEKALADVLRIKSHNSSVSNPADFNTPGVLQIEYGYGGYFRGNGFRSQHAGTLSVIYAATERIGFELDIDTVASQQDTQLVRTTGVGDSRLGIQIDIAGESARHPSFAVSYFAKLPSASVSKNLGTGRVDHMVQAMFSKRIGEFNVDLNSGFLINGKEGEKGVVTGGQFAFGVARDLTKKINLQGEIYGESKDSDEPKGLFAAGIFDYQFNGKVSFNAGIKIGLTPMSPRVGLTAGITYAFASFFKRRK